MFFYRAGYMPKKDGEEVFFGLRLAMKYQQVTHPTKFLHILSQKRSCQGYVILQVFT
jgi:hypothetical protein